MIKRNQAWLNRLNAFIDFLLIIIAYGLSAWLRLRVLTQDTGNMALTRGMVLAAVIYAAGLLLVLALMGFYSTTRIRKIGWKLGILVIATTVTELVAATLLFVFRLEEFSRGIILIFYVLTLILLGGKYVASRLLLDQLRVQGFNIKHEVVIGNGALARQYMEDVGNSPELGIQIDTTVHPDDERLEEILAEPSIDEVVIALEAEEYGHITTLIAACEKNGVRYLVIPFYNDLIPAHPVIENVGRSKLINMRTNRLEDIGWAVLKRGFDIVVSAVGLTVLSPLLLLIAAGVKLSSPGPVLFKQVRVGYNRREFRMLKFRSMRVNDDQDTAWSTARDDRRTKFGSLIRKTSLDELPQLINVLRGDMSLVGPRPELPHFVEQFKEEIPLYMVKHQVKPGITGWAQVNGYRGDTSIAKRIELDLWYIDNWSPWLDIRILFMTLTGGMVNNERMGDTATADADARVVIAVPKACWLPKDPLYVPVQTGAAWRPNLGLTPDNTGDNISVKYPGYGELTALYWAWRHRDDDWLGLAPHHCHFTLRRFRAERKNVLTLDQARMLLGGAEVILPPRRKYWIETNAAQYARVHDARDLERAREVLSQRCPEYLEAFDRSMRRTSGHRFNMFIMRRDVLDRYCVWLFDVLSALDNRTPEARFSEGDPHVFGYVAERLLDVWLETNAIKCREIPCVFMEKRSWVARGAHFLKQKLEKRGV